MPLKRAAAAWRHREKSSGAFPPGPTCLEHASHAHPSNHDHRTHAPMFFLHQSRLLLALALSLFSPGASAMGEAVQHDEEFLVVILKGSVRLQVSKKI